MANSFKRGGGGGGGKKGDEGGGGGGRGINIRPFEQSMFQTRCNRIEKPDDHHLGTLTSSRKVDPYRELELYLAQVIEEIDGIIVTPAPTPSIETPLEDCRNEQLENSIPTNPLNVEHSNDNEFLSNGGNTQELVNESINSTSTPESNSISTSFIPQPKQSVIESPVIQYEDLLNEFGINCNDDDDDDDDDDGDGDDDDNNNISNYTFNVDGKQVGKERSFDVQDFMLNSDYDEPRDMILTTSGPRRKSGSSPGNLDKGLTQYRYEATSSDYDEPNNSLDDYPPTLIKRNSSSLPINLELSRINSQNSNSNTISNNSRCCEIIHCEPKKNIDLSLMLSREVKTNENNKYAKLPPRNRKNNIPKSPMSLKKRRIPNGFFQKLNNGALDDDLTSNNINTTDSDYVFIENSRSNERSKSVDNSNPKSAPATPTTEDKFFPIWKLLRKINTSNFHRDNLNNDVVLVRVSSLPDQDLLDISNERLNDIKSQDNNMLMMKKKRSISPLTLRSDVTAKRLSESDKDISQVSPVRPKIFPSIMKQNDVAVSCNLTKDDKDTSDSSIEREKMEYIKSGTNGRIREDQNTRSSSLPTSLASLLSRLRNGSGSCCPSTPAIEPFTCTDMATQTSPAISRSSSFTWVSDCESPRAESHLDAQSLQDERTLDAPASPQDTVDDDNRSSSSSQDLLQSMDEISSGSISPDATDRASPLESGIGTASPPRSTNRRLVKPSTNNKCHRKETWERIRRRPSKLHSRFEKGSTDVWVKRESVHTQTRADEDRGSQEAADSSSGVDDTLPRTKPPRPTNFPLGITMTTSSSLSSAEMLEALPRAPSSPSAASLQLKHEPLTVELSGKSNSAPLLENNRVGDTNGPTQLEQPRSQSERQLSEIEAQEACKWLRAAGFPQYAQMYEDYQFPIDVSGVAKDHPFLEADSLQSLYRRLHALNRCANMKIDTHHTHHSSSHGKTTKGEDSDEDTQCALSENWTFEKKTRRWSRVCDISQANVERLQAIAAGKIPCEDDSLDDRLEAEEAEDTMMDGVRFGTISQNLPDELSPRFRRTGSERLRDGAKAFLRRVESLKSRRRKKQNREGVVISGPQILDVITMQQKMKDLNCVDVSPTGLAPMSFGDLVSSSPNHRPASPVTLPSSPYHLQSSNLITSGSPFGDDSSSYCSDGSQGGGPTPTPTRTRLHKAKRFLYRGREDQGALSDSECQPSSWRHRYLKDANSNHTKVLEYVTAHSHSHSHQQSAKESPSKSSPINSRGGSLNLGKDSQRYRDKLSNQDRLKEDKVAMLKREDKLHKSFRHIRDDSYKDCKQSNKEVVTIYREKSRSRSSELAGSQESSSTMASRDSDQEDESPRHKGTVVRWHSFQRGSLYPEPLDPLCPRAMASMSCGQLLVLRKLALLKLTACMERYCPTHRTGWNWELPKFIRKIKAPDYKDKTVFGVPLLLSLQRTGQALPKCIQIALRWLRANALDQVGIFRKSGVRSRIQKLKAMTETQGDNINFDGQQAFDVADLVKQYFRELPEALLTNKLSETFIAIFQHVPVELRPDAVQCVLLLLPDEHREALETLLDFLNHVASNSPYNQMTASNLAVCLAPSLFHFNHSNSNVTNRSNSVSPRRRKTVGIPDQRELSENKAAHDCLLYLVKMHRELFMVSSDMLTQCHFNYMEESIPVALEELGSEMKQDWRGYMYACTTALLKEAREKSRGWVSVNNPADSSVEMAYKKVGDGHPLRLWRVSTEVEAPPNELLHRVLRERNIWDPQLLKYRMVKKLDTNAEIFQYAAGNMSPLPARDYCVLRTWRTDLPKDACVIVETSVEHPDAPVMLGGTRGIVLASRYLIEKCGSGKSRIMHLSRVDTKGRTPEWYNKSYGHIAALYLSKIRNSFKHTSDGPESKV